MKRRVLTIPLLAAMGALVLSSSSGGPWQGANQNRTGSAGSTANCAGSGCHAANSAATTVTILVTTAGGTAVTSYAPGATYNVRIMATNTSGLSHFGFQATAVEAASTGTQAGTFAAAGTSVAVRTAPTPDIVEHSTPIQGTTAGGVSSYIATFSWTAPATGVGTVRFLATGNAVNRDGSTSGDQPAAATPLDLTQGSGTSVPGVAAASLKLYPNPAGNTLNLQLPDAVSQGSFQIRDIRGSLVSGGALQIAQGESRIDVSGLSSGAYFVQVQSAGSQMVAPFVKH